MSVPTEPAGALLRLAATARPVSFCEIAPQDGPVLVIAPHPDDETLGCGAAIASALAEGRDVWIALLTAGTASHPASRRLPPEGLGCLRLLEFARACGHLAAVRSRPGRSRGRLGSRFLGLRDGKIPADEDGLGPAIDDLVALAERTGARSLWTTWGGDPHTDHEAAAVLGAAVARACAARGQALDHRAYAVWGRFGPLRGGWRPRGVWPFDCTVGRQAKRAAMGEYRSQLTRLVADDPDGFVMPPRLVPHFAEAHEIFLLPEPTR